MIYKTLELETQHRIVQYSRYHRSSIIDLLKIDLLVQEWTVVWNLVFSVSHVEQPKPKGRIRGEDTKRNLMHANGCAVGQLGD